jgi:hypothetical protein
MFTVQVWRACGGCFRPQQASFPLGVFPQAPPDLHHRMHRPGCWDLVILTATSSNALKVAPVLLRPTMWRSATFCSEPHAADPDDPRHHKRLPNSRTRPRANVALRTRYRRAKNRHCRNNILVDQVVRGYFRYPATPVLTR